MQLKRAFIICFMQISGSQLGAYHNFAPNSAKAQCYGFLATGHGEVIIKSQWSTYSVRGTLLLIIDAKESLLAKSDLGKAALKFLLPRTLSQLEVCSGSELIINAIPNMV